jgi:hypothetical protein
MESSVHPSGGWARPTPHSALKLLAAANSSLSTLSPSIIQYIKDTRQVQLWGNVRVFVCYAQFMGTACWGEASQAPRSVLLIGIVH